MPLRHILIYALLAALCFSTAVYAGTARVDSRPVSVKRTPAQSISGRVDGDRPVSVKRGSPAQPISGRVDGGRPVSVKRHSTQSINGRVDGVRPVSVGIQKLNDLIPGLVGYWPMDGDWKDKSGNEYNGTAYGGAAFSNISGVHGTNAGSFDGTDDYVKVGPSILSSKTNCTISGWIRPDTFTQSATWNRRIYNECSSSKGGVDVVVTPTGHVWAGVYRTDTGWQALTSVAALETGKWSHFTVTFEPTGLKVYVNGVFDSAYTGNCQVTNTAVTDAFIGKTISGSTSGGYYDGLMDELALFDRALSADEVNSLYLNGIKPPLNAPVVNPVTTPTADLLLNLSGTKDPGTSLWLNGVEVVPADGSSAWQTAYALHEGSNTLKFSAHDNAANVSEEVRIDVVLDTIPPVIGSVSVDGGAASTKDADVALQVSATDAGSGLGSMRFSNDGETWTDWIPYAATAAWTLAPGDGDKTVYAKVMDKAGNISAVATDAITLDTVQPPAPEITGFTTPTGSASQAISGTKAAEVVSIKVALNGAQPAGVSATYPTPTTWTATVSGLVEGENTVGVTGLDDAGNESEDSAPVTILLDKFPPVWSNKPGVRFIEPGDGLAVVRWDGAKDAEYAGVNFNIYRSDVNPINYSNAEKVTVSADNIRTDYYQASKDFSSKQGQRNWYYYSWTGSSYELMTFDSANNRWKRGSGYPLTWSSGGHPYSSMDSARAWRAPYDGIASITGKAYDGDPYGGDGVIVSIWNEGFKLWEQVINNANSTGYSFNIQTEVAAGDNLYFRIGPRTTNYNNDSTYFNPSIAFSHTGEPNQAEGYDYQCTLSGLANNTPRYFAVRAVDAFGNEDGNSVTLKAVPQATAGAKVDYLAEHWTGTLTGLAVGVDGSISLLPGAVSGTYESPDKDLGYGNSLSAVSFNSVSDASLNQAVEMEVDDGSGWTAVMDGQQDGLPAGQSVRYRVTLTGDGSASPVLSSVSLAYNDFIALDAPSVEAFSSPTRHSLLSITGRKEAGASVWINGAEAVPSDVSIAWGATVTLTNEGDNAFSAYSRDAAGNQSQPVFFTVVRDTTAPSIASSSPSNGSVSIAVSGVFVTLSDAGSSPDLAASLTGAKVMRGTSEVAGTWTVTGVSLSFSPAEALSDGSYTVSLYPVDTLGNRVASPSTFGFTVDTAVPTVTLSMNPVSPHRAETVAFTLAFNEAMDPASLPVMTFGLAEPFNSYVIGGGVWSADKRSFTVSFTFSQTVPEGAYTVPVSGAKDLAGNQMVVSHPAAFELDMTPPAAPAVNEAASPTKMSTVALSGTKDAGGSVIINGTERVPVGTGTAWSYQYLLAEGVNDLRVTSKDAAGNESAQTTPAPRVVLDTTPPDFTVNYTTPSANTTQVISGTKEPGCVLKVDGVTVAAETDTTSAWSYEVTLSNGLSNKLTLTASDALGNAKTKTISILCDANAPSPLALGALEAYGEGDGASVTLKWTAYNEALVPDLGYYRVYVSTSEFTAVSGMGPLNTTNKGVRTYTVTGLEPGRTYWFAVVPVDQNSNFDTNVNCASAAPYDTKAPEEVTNLAATATFDGAAGVNSVNLAWTKSVNTRKDLATQKVYFDGGSGYDAGTDIGPDAASFARTGLPDAAHVKFRLTVADLAGNESTGRVVEATTRIANPVTVTSVPGSNKADVTWSKASSPYLKEYRVYIAPGGASLSSVTGMSLVKTTTATAASISGLTNGETYQVAVTSVNTSMAENAEVTSVAVSPRSDADGPSITAFDVKVGGAVVSAGSAVVKPGVVTVSASDAESAMSKVELYVDGTLALSQTGGSLFYNWDVVQTNDGSHTLTVKAYDSPGNVTVLDKAYVVNLAPPSAPSITGHSLNVGTNPPSTTVSGSCMAGTTVALIVDGVAVAMSPSQNGSFQFVGVVMKEGVNAVYARASHRGGESPLSARYEIVVDTGAPVPPVSLAAKPLPGGTVRLTWSAGTGEAPAGYNLYASAGSFSSKDGTGVTKTNASLIKYALTDYKPQDDLLRYYAVTSVDAAGNESAISGVVSAASDRTAPGAVSIKYSYTANGGTVTDPAQTAGPGKVDASLTVSEPLGETPFFSLTPSSGSPVVVSLSKLDDTHWKGEFPVTSLTPQGQTQYRFTGKDVIGNRGEAGGTGITIDVKGPAVSVSEPASLLKITGQPVTVKAAFDEPPVGFPALELVDYAGAPVRVLGLTDDGDGRHFTGSVDISGMSEGDAHFNLTSAVDRFGNYGNTVASGGSVLLYANLPPAPPVPEGLAVKSEKGGKLTITWKPVSGALSYKLYRNADGETEPALLQGGLTSVSAVDIPEADGLYYYSVSSVGQLSSESAKSAAVSAVSDRTPPSAPAGLALTFGAGGVSAAWTAPEGEAAASYNLYRSGSQISSVSGLTPALKGIKALKASDPLPVSSLRYYAVTAVDALGNEGQPSVSGYITFPVAPPWDLMLIRLEGTAPLLVWEEPQVGVAYNIYRNGSKLTSSPSSQTAYTDASYDGGKVVYGVSAVDGYGNESPVKEVAYTGFEAGLAPDVTLNRGYIQKLPVLLVNPGDAGVSVDGITLRVGSAAESALAGPFDVAAGSTLQVEKIGSTSLDSPPEVAVSVTAEWSPSPGVTVMVSNSRTATVAGAGATMEVYSEPLVRGTNAKVRLKVYNSGDSDMDFVTSENGGATSRAVVTLKDEDGNVLAQGKLNQRADFSGNIINGASYAVARIAPGESFTTDEITFPVPATAPYAVVIDAAISGTYYHYDKPEQVSAPGISLTVPTNINETAYRAQAVVAQAFYPGSQPVLITGSAVNNNTDAPMSLVPVVIGVSVKGFDRYFTVNSDASGNFSYTFKPGANEAGIYSVWARHPDVSDRSVQATFTIAGLQMSPTTAKVTVLRGGSFDIPLTLKNIGDTPITGMSYTMTAGSGVSGTVVNGPTRVEAGKTINASFRVSAAGDAPDVSTVKLDVRTAEGPSDRLDTTVIMVSAIPIISVTPKSYVDTGVVRGDQRLESLTITNTGAGMLKNTRVDGPALPWITLATAREIGDVPPGGKASLAVMFSPDASVPQKVYNDSLTITSDNHIPYRVNLQCTVVTNAVGSAQFDVMNSFGEKVKGASIRIQNAQLTELVYTKSTDALGTELFADIPAGSYVYTVSASGCKPYSGSFEVIPGVVVLVPVALDVTTVEVEFTVTPVVIEDRYEITITQTFKTNVPVPVLVVEPPVVNLPPMKSGQVFNGEFTVTNQGLLDGDNFTFTMPTSIGDKTIECLGNVPPKIKAKQSVTIPFRVIKK
ncbi:MAG: hypothetical protein HZC51_03925 [Nitrospirae bacterium]|nr:hypothetical protein [Nitrospirota bacterium]